MTDDNYIEVHNLSEVVEQIGHWNAQHEEAWFRGQTDSRWLLQPGAYRPDFRQSNETDLIDHFRRLAAPGAMRFGLDDWGWVTYAQHHTVPTRLLDWSTSPLPALFFAVSNEMHEEEATHSSFCMIKPWEMNREFFNNSQKHGPLLLLDSKEELEPLRPGAPANSRTTDKPVAVIAPTTFDRIRFQEGTFTTYARPSNGNLNEHDPISKGAYFHKLIIPKKSRHSILEELRTLGIDEYFIYRDNDRLARQVQQKFMGGKS